MILPDTTPRWRKKSRAVPHRKAGVLGHYGGLRRTAAAFLYLTGDVPLLWWIPCMAAALHIELAAMDNVLHRQYEQSRAKRTSA